MEKTTAYKYFLGLGILLVIGFFIMFFNFNQNYYRARYYNNLPPLHSQNPVDQQVPPQSAPIQHYEQARDESVKETEQHITEINTGANTTLLNNTGYVLMTKPFNSDGSFNYYYFILIFGLAYAIRRELMLPFNRYMYHNWPSALLASTGMIYLMNNIMTMNLGLSTIFVGVLLFAGGPIFRDIQEALRYIWIKWKKEQRRKDA